MRLHESRQGHGVALVPAAMLFAKRLRIVAGAEKLRVEQVAMDLGEVRSCFQCPAAAGDRSVHIPLVLQHVAQVVMRLGIIRIEFQRPAAAGGRFIELVLFLEGNAQVVVRPANSGFSSSARR